MLLLDVQIEPCRPPVPFIILEEDFARWQSHFITLNRPFSLFVRFTQRTVAFERLFTLGLPRFHMQVALRLLPLSGRYSGSVESWEKGQRHRAFLPTRPCCRRAGRLFLWIIFLQCTHRPAIPTSSGIWRGKPLAWTPFVPAPAPFPCFLARVVAGRRESRPMEAALEALCRGGGWSYAAVWRFHPHDPRWAAWFFWLGSWLLGGVAVPFR
jgi:hypothetical protein